MTNDADCRPPTARLGDERGGSGTPVPPERPAATERRGVEPSNAEIEAAARRVGWIDWPRADEMDRDCARREARDQLAAALPLVEARLREQIAAEIDAEAARFATDGPYQMRHGLTHAARIARGNP